MTPTVDHVPTSDGITLVADVYTNTNTDAGAPTVLLLHGGGQNRHAWSNTACNLHRAGHTVIAYDTRGHGDSGWDPAGRYDMQQLADDLLTVRDRYSPRHPPVVVGASMGGMTILTTHRVAPSDLWGGVILVDVTPRMDITGAQRVVGFMSAHPDGFASLAAAADVIAHHNPHRKRPADTSGLHKVLQQRPDGRWIWRWDPRLITSKRDILRSDPRRFHSIAEDLTEGARRITAPTLLVRGAQSDLVSTDAVADFLDAVPHAEYVDVSGTGHMVAGDDNDAFTAAVTGLPRSTTTTEHGALHQRDNPTKEPRASRMTQTAAISSTTQLPDTAPPARPRGKGRGRPRRPDVGGLREPSSNRSDHCAAATPPVTHPFSSDHRLDRSDVATGGGVTWRRSHRASSTYATRIRPTSTR